MADVCRLCAGPCAKAFDAEVLGRYQVGYYVCEQCGSLQTETPYWLDEAYAIPGVHIDVGQAARVIATWVRLCLFLERLNFPKAAECVDYGGSTGLLARLMRDIGYGFQPYDRYANCTFANYFKVSDFADCRPKLITAFEVLEHFPQPAQSLQEILNKQSDLIIFSTMFYEKQGRDWFYLVPFCGQHVFFYDEIGLARFVQTFGYDLAKAGSYWVLFRQAGPYSAAMIAEAGSFTPDVEYSGQLLTALGYGTAETARDHDYAKQLFVNQLPTGGDTPAEMSKVRRPGTWRGRVAQWLQGPDT